MLTDNVQKVFEAAEPIFDELKTKESRTTYKEVTQRVVEQTGLSATVVNPIVQMYVKGRADLYTKLGRAGGIYKVFVSASETNSVEEDSASMAKSA